MRKGFTLIELVMVIVILGILAAVAIPKFIDLSTEARDSSTRGALGALRSAISMQYAKNFASGTIPTGGGSTVAWPDATELSALMQYGVPVNAVKGTGATVITTAENPATSVGWIYTRSSGDMRASDRTAW